MTLRRIASISSAALLALAGVARAGGDDRYSINPDYPVRMEDAFPLDKGEAYVGLSSRYIEGSDGHGVTQLQPEVAVGLLDGLDLHVLSPILVGGGEEERTGSGNINLNLQYLALEQHEGDWWPSIAVEGDLIAPTGIRADGLDTAIQVIATQTLSWSPTYDAVHLNLTWTHNAAPDGDTERDDGYTAILGYSRRVLPDTVLLADVVWERTLEKDEAGQLAEVGVIQSLGEHVDLTAGVGIGLGDDAPDYTVTVGVLIQQ